MVNPFQDIGSFAQDWLLFPLVYYMPQIFSFLSSCWHYTEACKQDCKQCGLLHIAVVTLRCSPFKSCRLYKLNHFLFNVTAYQTDLRTMNSQIWACKWIGTFWSLHVYISSHKYLILSKDMNKLHHTKPQKNYLFWKDFCPCGSHCTSFPCNVSLEDLLRCQALIRQRQT